MVRIYFGKYFAKGEFQYAGEKVNMIFDEFTLGDGNGKMSAKGHDEIGAFTMTGSFDATKETSAIKILKQYTSGEQHVVEYNGKIDHFLNNTGVESRQFKIHGKWACGGFEEDFLIESIYII